MKLENFSVNDINGNKLDLEKFNGKTVLIVNVASRCGLTPQYKQLEEIYRKYKDQGLEIIGFPCNQFKGQEPGSLQEIKNFCETNYGITFTLTEKVDVLGENQHPIFKWLIEKNPIVNDPTKCMSWNFTKFLIDKNGDVVNRFAPIMPPNEFVSKIESVL